MALRPPPPSASFAEPSGDGRLHAPSAARNAAALTELLSTIAPLKGNALELASGTGQHVVQFARALPALDWQPTDLDPDRLTSISAYVSDAALPNLNTPLTLDATTPGWGADHTADLIVLVNLLHLISRAEAQTLIREAACALTPGGTCVFYGPFTRAGQLTSTGDAQFHARLIAADPAIGYKDDSDITTWLQAGGLTLARIAEMPANNLAFIARKPI